MNVTEAIDEAVTIVDGVPSAVAAAGGDGATRRTRYLRALRDVFSYVYLYPVNWTFRRASPTITVPAGQGWQVMPTSFFRMPYQGGVYNTTTGQRLRYVDSQEITDLREGPNPLQTDNPTVYSIFGQDGTTHLDLFQIPKNSAALTFKLWSDTDVPVLDESSNADNLKVIPERWHALVLLPGVLALMQTSKGDPRYGDFTKDPRFVEGLRLMVADERHGDDTPDQLPSFWGDSEWP